MSDKWKATVSSLKAYRVETGLTTRTLPHEVVNHSEGEIVNSNGFTTNRIETKWAVMKRWIRNRGGGLLPKHGDGDKWAALIYEYQGRNLLMTRAHRGIHHDPCSEASCCTKPIRSSINSHSRVVSMLSLTLVSGDTSHAPEHDATTNQNVQDSHLHRGALYIAHDLQMHMRNAIVPEPLMKQLCSQEQGPREAAMVVYPLVHPAFMRLMEHDPLTLLDEFILLSPPLPIPSAPVPQSRLGKLRDGSCLQPLCIMIRVRYVVIVCFGVERKSRCTCFFCPCIQAKAAASIKPNLASSTRLLRSQIL